ncbi:MAG: hypothetical protein WCV69_02150 [Patescibacteria group bacterium]|jgi:hypothetical protein
MKISEIFDLKKSQYELDFVDVNIDGDTPLFLDSYFIKNSKSRFGQEASKDIQSFTNHFFGLLRSDLRQEALGLFSYLGEPNETCLGLSRGKPMGRGIGPINTRDIFDSIVSSSAYHAGVLEHLEDLRIFVEGIDKDKTSDMCTNIIRGRLIEYTKNQCHLWGISLTPNIASGFIWNRLERKWENYHADMLVIDNRKILLVPKSMVTYSKDYTSAKYLQHFILNFLQRDHLNRSTHLVQIYKRQDGSERRFVTKESIKDDLQKNQNIELNKEFLVNFTINNPEVFNDFKINTKDFINRIRNEDITEEALDDIIEHLKNKLANIQPGNTQASEYHKTMMGALELLFYPSLINPILEQEIHEGRKRIDVVFENNAETGFFFQLPTIHRMSSSNIMVECKNYSEDISNQALDQMSGRFNPNRGRVGLIVCRNIDDMNTFILRCKDTFNDDRGVIVPLVDQDIILALDQYKSDRNRAIEGIIQNRFNQLLR